MHILLPSLQWTSHLAYSCRFKQQFVELGRRPAETNHCSLVVKTTLSEQSKFLLNSKALHLAGDRQSRLERQGLHILEATQHRSRSC